MENNVSEHGWSYNLSKSILGSIPSHVIQYIKLHVLTIKQVDRIQRNLFRAALPRKRNCPFLVGTPSLSLNIRGARTPRSLNE